MQIGRQLRFARLIGWMEKRSNARGIIGGRVHTAGQNANNRQGCPPKKLLHHSVNRYRITAHDDDDDF
jgi:hypothetical protein